MQISGQGSTCEARHSGEKRRSKQKLVKKFPSVHQGCNEQLSFLTASSAASQAVHYLSVRAVYYDLDIAWNTSDSQAWTFYLK